MPTRPHGLSEMSSISRGSFDSCNHRTSSVPASSSLRQAVRQPVAPPEISMLQRHDGFARFLKQHASPPHHRVTAGGRIVPAGPCSPPPMFDFASLNGLLRERPIVSKPAQNELQPDQKIHQQEIQPQIFPLATLEGYLASQGSTATGLQSYPMISTSTAMPYNNAGSSIQASMHPTMQSPTAVIPMGIFPDGSTLVSYNGINYRTYWNGLNQMMEPLNATTLSPGSQLFSATYPQEQDYNVIDPANQPTQLTPASIPLTSTTNESRVPSLRFNELSQMHVHDREEAMRAQLSNLDKHLALHHYDITPVERTAFVAQRRQLVQEIDKMRLSKEPTKNTLPIVASATRATSHGRVAHLGTEEHEKLAKANNMNNGFDSLVPTKANQNMKCLSPAALPFVPMSMQKKFSPSSKSRSSSEQIPKPQREEPRPGWGTLRVKDVTAAAMNRKAKIVQAQQSNSPTTVRQRDSSLSTVLDASDPAMRVIEFEDIEYAARYLYNWDRDKKAYCTTVEEFQEAIRRVREQARMYGCAGGSSKDPAYDAEQDLWWAICDRDAIPLPTETPDHVTDPRPWNWNDSAFNYRRRGAPSPGPAPEHARSSPRLSGWDTTFTNSMKDIMDVSRSYYALKGQLLSVPFRDYAYDRYGNRIMIEPEVTDPAAKFGAARIHLRSNSLPVSNAATANDAKLLNRSSRSKILRDLNQSDVNGRYSRKSENGPANHGRKQNLTDGDTVRLVSSLQEKKSLKQMTADPAKYIAPGSDTQHQRHIHQPFVADCPETPTARHIRANSKGSPTPRSNPYNSLYQSAYHGSNDKAEVPLRVVQQQSCKPNRDSGTPTNVSDTVCPAQKVPSTPKPLVRPRAIHLTDPDNLQMLQAQVNQGIQHEFNLSGDTLQASDKSSLGRLVKFEDANPDSEDLSAQTKSQWGPEDETQSCRRQDHGVTRYKVTGRSVDKDLIAAKVNMPGVAAVQSPAVNLCSASALNAKGMTAANNTRQVAL